MSGDVDLDLDAYDDGLSWDEWFRALPLNPFEDSDDDVDHDDEQGPA